MLIIEKKKYFSFFSLVVCVWKCVNQKIHIRPNVLKALLKNLLKGCEKPVNSCFIRKK